MNCLVRGVETAKWILGAEVLYELGRLLRMSGMPSGVLAVLPLPGTDWGLRSSEHYVEADAELRVCLFTMLRCSCLSLHFSPRFHHPSAVQQQGRDKP